MSTTTDNINSAIFYMVYKTIFLVDSPAEFTMEIILQSFRLPDTL